MLLRRAVCVLRFFPLILIGVVLMACSPPPPPKDPHDICHIYAQYPKWYWLSEAAYRKWGLPDYVQLAVMYQESSFKADAKPPRTHLLGIIPWRRVSTAQGYSQALDGTWKFYESSVHHGGSRSDFADAVDFMGWYYHMAYRADGISSYDVYGFYLAYHEGIGGYAHHSYLHKPWLVHVAKKVAVNASMYRYQLSRCEAEFPQRPALWWHY